MVRTIIAVLGLVALLGMGSLPARAEDMDMTAKISAAKTAADHEAIAADYAKQAASLKEDAERHDKMAKGYMGLGKGGRVHAEQFCASIAKREREQAKDFEALAELHRAEAKQLGK